MVGHHSEKFGGHRHCSSRDTGHNHSGSGVTILVCCDLARSCDQRVMQFQPHMVSHQPAKFGGYKHGGIEDMFLVVEGQDSTFKSNISVYL